MSFKICSIGCGYMATAGHGPAFKKYASIHSDVVLAGCCDIDEKRAVEFKEKFGFKKHYTDMHEMLDAEKPDAVCLISPVHLTAKLSIEIMEKGYPIILEKPPGMNREETLRMIEVAERTGVPNQVAFNRRYIPLNVELKRLLSEAVKPEDIQNFRCDFNRVRRKDSDFSTTAIHGIDNVRFLAGSDYKHIHFSYQNLPQYGPTVVNIFMDCEFENGKTAQLSFCPVAGITCERITVHAYEHSFMMHVPMVGTIDAEGKLMHIQSNEIKLDISAKDVSDSTEMFVTNGFYGENASFFDDVRAGRKPVNDLKSSLQSVEVAECIRNRVREYSK
jgi:myo-inositol 2-dehydrogenase/D-chiro-inositol 1-dehydrogenase